MKKIIDDTIKYIKEFFEEEYSGHDFYHSLRVYELAQKISKGEDCDIELVCLSALLHDVDDYKIVGEQEKSFKNARAFLQKVNYPEDKIEKICDIISQVSFKGKYTVTPNTIEGKIVQDADRLDAIGAIGIARTFTFGGNHKLPIYNPNIDYKDIDCSQSDYKKPTTTINHFYEKLLKLKDLMNTETAKKIAEHRHELMLNFLEEFYKEWNVEI